MPLTTPVKHCGRFDSSIELIVVNRLYPGDYLGEASILTGVARNAAVEAVTAATRERNSVVRIRTRGRPYQPDKMRGG